MTNKEFIEKYGKIEFYDMCNYVYEQLMFAKMGKKIKKFKINHKRKNVMFYKEDNSCIYIDYATIFHIGCDNLNQYIKGGI